MKQNRRAGDDVRRFPVVLRSHVERCLQDIWDTRSPLKDADGDYPFRYGTAVGWVGLVPTQDEPGVAVFAHAVRGLRPSARLLKELNELNAGSRWVTIALYEGVVQVRTELHWTAVERESLERALQVVGGIADDIGLVLAAVYGGQTPCPAEASEWDEDAQEAA